MSMPLVKITGASLFIPGQLPRDLVLKDINLEIYAGAHLALRGENGSGKSSLLRLIHGDLWPCTGEIVWLDNGHYQSSPIAGRQLCALVSPALQATWQARQWQMSVRAFLEGGWDGCFCQPERIEPLLSELGAEDLLALELPMLSQGQMRLVLLAQALLRKPALLLLDEWSDGLDMEHRRLALAALEKRATSITMLFASPRSCDLPDWATECIYLEAGVLQHGRPPEPAQGKRAMVQASGPERSGPPLFELENVSVVRDGNAILKNINWRMTAHENWLLAGPNGAGKSTFMRLLAGDEFAYAGGSLRHWSPRLGRYVVSLPEKRQCVRLVSDLGQACYGYPLNGLELVLSGRDNTDGLYRNFEANEIAWAKSLLELFFGREGKKISEQSIRRLSSGQLRLLHLCRALVGQPDVLLLDEPCSGLDENKQAQFFDLLGKLAGAGVWGWKPALILISHQIGQKPGFITRCAKMNAGTLDVEDDDIK